MKCYFKISNSVTDLDSTDRNEFIKVELLYLNFVTASMLNFKLGKNVSVDEQRIFIEKQSRNNMQIDTKTAVLRFKIYSLYLGNYLYNFLFASKVAKISKFQKNQG